MPAHTMPDPVRFASKTQRDPVTGCLLWTAARLAEGYGVFSIRHKTVRANKWALEQKLGRPLRDGMQACHSCDNPPCVEPSHLYEGTPVQNGRDKVVRDRQPWGENAPGAKLTEEQARDVARQVATGVSQTEVARRFGVNQSTVSRIVRGERWARLEVSSADA